MALGMRHWLGLVGLGFVLAAIWALPPSVVELVGPPQRTREALRHSALLRDLSDSHATLKRIRWMDSLSARIVASAEEQPVVLAPATVDPAQLAELRDLMAARAHDLERRDPQIVLGYVFQPLDHGGDPSIRTDERGRIETYVGRRDGIDYCLRIDVTRGPALSVRRALEDLRDRSRAAPTLGTCRLYAKYGLPGEPVRRWLEHGATAYARRDVAQTASEPATPWFGRRYIFGSYLFGRAGSLTVDQCLAGREDACAAIFLDPGLAELSITRDREQARRAAALSVRDDARILSGEGMFLLSDLERAFGPEAFARFWTSDADVESAFRDAFGVEVGAWMLSWADATLGVDLPGPQLAGSGSTLPVVLTLALFALVAIARVRKHTVA